MSDTNTNLIVPTASDSIATVPIDKLTVLRADVRACRLLLDAIDDCFSPEWREAHVEFVEACKRANAELKRVTQNPKTRYGSWRTPADVELMKLGYL